MCDRRAFLGVTAVAAANGLTRSLRADEVPKGEAFVPIRTVRRGLRHYWFAYYDKLQFDLTNRFVLCNHVDFEHRSPTAHDVVRISMVDRHDNDRWIELGTSRAWGWQQGRMLQWLPSRMGTRARC